jgi:hypothetical protein
MSAGAWFLIACALGAVIAVICVRVSIMRNRRCVADQMRQHLTGEDLIWLDTVQCSMRSLGIGTAVVYANRIMPGKSR